jgi:acetolactate synthase I/II/III large subunit
MPPTPTATTGTATPDTAEPRTGAEVLVTALVDQGIEVVFLNPGTDTAPVQEALARLAEAGVAVPRVVLCPHEALALAAAHAYHAITGRPQLVMVHVDVGTQNLGSMVHDALRGEAGVVVLAGLTPVTALGELPGGRDTPVHWQQDVPDQAGIVRPYVKWSGELRTVETIGATVRRAFQVAGSGPAGPVYLTAARELLMAEPSGPPPATTRDDRRYGTPAPPAPDEEALQAAAALLDGARSPVLVTSRLGRRPEAVPELVALAERLGAAVVDRRERVNFPSDHPAYVGDPVRAREVLEAADAVLVVDCDVPWVPVRVAVRDDARVVLVDADPVKASIPGWSFPADVRIQADPLATLRRLNGVLAGSSGRGRPDLPPAPPAARPPDDAIPDAAAVAAALDDVLADDDVVLDEAVTGSDALRAGVRRTRPGTWFQSGGSGLGWAIGAALGTGLALPGRRLVAVVGDGAFLFGQPAAGLWATARHRTPVLVVVLCNGGYAASRRPVLDLFPGGTSATAGDVLGTRFSDGGGPDGPGYPAPDYAALARACGATGEDVPTVGDLRPALRRGLDAVTAGQSALVAVRVTSPWF